MNLSLDFEGKIAPQQLLATAHAHSGILDLTASERVFIEGDNLSSLKAFLPDLRQKIDLIYIDPPFGTGQPFSDIEATKAYSDEIQGEEFLAFIWKRLVFLRECLSPQGSIYLHIDKKIGHYIKIMMDELFGEENFINDLSRIKCNPKNFARKAYGNYSDMILYYAKNRDQQIWNDLREKLEEEDIQRLFPKKHPKYGPYTTHPLHAPGPTQNGDTGLPWKGILPPPGRHWRYGREELDRLESEGLVEWSSSGNPRKIVFARDHKGKKIQDVWTFKDKGLSYVQYPTQKNHKLLERIILNSSNEDSWVMDAFAGSGGTLWMAESLKRKWIGMDQSPMSIRLIHEHIEKLKLNVTVRTVSS
ncbi:MAG: site-specific DNA-methyltransferase [Bacteroidia bacterium]|nr:site-specific DNA-methyltransferase [Bacteroidia bacterium]